MDQPPCIAPSSPDEAITLSPPHLFESLKVFQDLMHRVDISLGIQVEVIPHNLHKRLDILQSPSPGKVILPINEPLLDLFLNTLVDPSIYTLYI